MSETKKFQGDQEARALRLALVTSQVDDAIQRTLTSIVFDERNEGLSAEELEGAIRKGIKTSLDNTVLWENLRKALRQS